MSKTWNSINPATLSGAIDVIVVEQEDGMVYQETDNSTASIYGLYRFTCLLALPCSLREIFAPSPVREESELRFTRNVWPQLTW